jgi:hypothetical protein
MTMHFDEAVTVGGNAVEQARTPPQTRRAWLALSAMSVTTEQLIYALVFVCALALRVGALGAQPLTQLEAASAWPAWLSAMALSAPNPPQPVSALLGSMQFLLIWLGLASDASMRLLPALAGSVLVILPWFWRRWMGRLACLLLAALLAVDPWLVTLSRTADGAMLSTFFGLLALSALATYLAADVADESVPVWWGSVFAVSAGMLLASGVQSWSWLVLLAIFVLVMGLARFRALLNWRNLAWFGGSVLMATFGGLVQSQQMGAISASLTGWIAQLTGAAGDAYPFSWPWMRIVVDQPFLLIFAVVGLLLLAGVDRSIDAANQVKTSLSRRWWGFGLGGTAWALLLLLAPGRSPFSLPMLTVFLATAAALGVASLLRMAAMEDDWREAGLLLAVLVALGLSILFWLSAAVYSRQFDSVLMRSVAVLILLAAFLAIAFAFWINRRQALIVVMGVSGVLLFAATFSSMWQLSFRFEPNRPDGFFATLAHPDVRNLATNLQTLSAQRLGDATELPVQLVTGSGMTPDPLLSWELRMMRNLSWPAAPRVAIESDPRRAPAVIVAGDGSGPQSEAQIYIGSDYRVNSHWLPSDLPALADLPAEVPIWESLIRPWLRWVLYRESPTPPQVDMVRLWATAE